MKVEAENILGALDGSTSNGADPARPGADWLAGSPMDPAATPAEPLPALPGFPFLHRGTGALIVGPTGGGRSSLMLACAYDAAKAGQRVGYLGFEVTEPEFNARAAHLARVRGDGIDDALRTTLARVRYLDLASVMPHAWMHPEGWVAGIVAGYDVIVIDPLSAVASALDLNFDNSNAEFVTFYDRLVQPITREGVAAVLVDNVGHALEAKSRAKGASAKADRADLTFSCALVSSPAALVVKVQKVRTVRAAFRRGDEWIFDRDTQSIERRGNGADEDDGGFRPTHLMEKVSVMLEDEAGASVNTIKGGGLGKREYVEAALRQLIAEGYVECRQQGQRRSHFSVQPYREADDPKVAQPGPETRASVIDQGPGHTDATEARENSVLAGNRTEAQPGPNRGPAPVQATEAPRPVYVVPGSRASVDEGEPDPDAEMERIVAKFGSAVVNGSEDGAEF